MTTEQKRELVKFLWKLLTALLAALGGAIGVSACAPSLMPLIGMA